jgi:tetratricopeptide (TPR) repeat protein
VTPRAPEALPWRALFAVLALAALAYANSFAGVPQYDDYNVIIDDPAVRSLAAWRAAMPGIRPLLKLSYAFNNSWGGLAGFHSLNLLLHLFNAALVLLVLRRLLPDLPAAALAGALLFALHPVNTEAVTMLSGRSVSLMSLFFLAGVLAHLGGRTLLSLVGLAAAVATRETALALPAVLTLVGFWQLRATPALPAGRALRSALCATRWHWLLALFALCSVLALPRYRELLAFSFAIRTPLENLLSQGGGVLYLLGQLLRPWALNADPVLPVFAGWNPRWVLVALASALLLGCAVLAALGGLTWQRNTVYHSETAFWSDVLAKSPSRARAWNNLGYALEHEGEGDPRAALLAYERAITLDPADYTPRFNRLALCRRVPEVCDTGR